MISQCLAILALAFLLHTSYGEANVSLTVTNRTLPIGQLMTLTTLICEIDATFPINGTSIESRWQLPNGEEGVVNGPSTKYVVTQGVTNGQFESVLLIQNVIYTDAGTYICRARDVRDPSNRGPWVEAPLAVELRVELVAVETDIAVFDNETQVSLSCEMSLYLRPDQDLQWFRDEELISDSSARYSISYNDGTPGKGQFGANALGSSRLSTLVISQPLTSDSGTYTCSIRNTQHSQNIQLSVESSGLSNPPTVQPTTTATSMTSATPPSSTISPVSGNSIPLPIIIGAIAGILGIVVVVLIIVIIVVSLRRRSHTATIAGNGDSYAALNGAGYTSASKMSVSPTPHDPPRRTNFGTDVETGYDRPHHPNNNNNNTKPSPPPITPAPDYECLDATKYDPYYDNPEDLKPSRAPAVPTNPPPKKSKGNMTYDEVESFPMSSKTSTLDMRSVPSPAVVLSGSLNRQIEQKNPDFAYPSYQDGFDLSGEPDYDQIYSEPLDPTMLRSNLIEGIMAPEEAVPYSAIYDDPANPFSDTDVPAPLKVSKSNIIEIRKLGTGQFGQVILAKTKGISLQDMGLSETDNDTTKSMLVAIKKLKQDAESGLMKAFDKEVKFMSRLKHDNVVRLLGVCTGTESFIMMEYMENGDLNQFLQKQALMSDSISGLQENQVTPIILLYIGVQIASGMHYLGSRRFVHRDLATRNCLVGKDFIVKISDFGMSRSLYESAYYRVQGTLVLPIRWMACETFYGKFSVKSDSWAFGVTLWEIYTLGKVDPYEDMTDEEVIADAIRGPDRKILPRPTTCPQEVYEIMQRCWVNEPSMRADFGANKNGDITITTSSLDRVPSATLGLSPSNTNPPSNRPRLARPDLPTAIIIGAIIVAGSILFLVLFILCVLCYFSRRKRKTRELSFAARHRRISNISDMQTTGFANPTDSNYSQQENKSSMANGHKPVRPALKPSISATNAIPVPLHYASNQLPEPREILAYRDVDLLEKFRPLPPPPPSLAAEYGPLKNKLYDVPEAMYDDGGRVVQGSRNGTPFQGAPNPYDEVETTPVRFVPKRSLRSQSVRTFGSQDNGRNGMVPQFQRTSSLKSPVQPSSFDHIYQEQLEPSMLYSMPPSEQGSSQLLPYGPIYDVPKPLKNTDDVLHIMPENVMEIRDLGMGRFGMVSLAATVGLSFKDIRLGENDDKNRSLLVAIKKLNPDGGKLLRESFEKEIKYMARLHHPNVVHLLGVSMVGVPFIMMEYMENGDLNDFLQKQTLVDDGVNLLQENEISPLVLLYMTVQIASGMRYLASQRVVHRDIATRNCLVGRDFVVKISDFGMSRKLYESFYYRVHGKLILPIRWMAYESFYGKFSVKSDVWAFGITMWEIYTLAHHEPYHEFSDEELIANAMKGDKRRRPARPTIVPNPIYDVMLRCWVHDPFMRGDFEEVYSRLFLAYTRMCQQCS